MKINESQDESFNYLDSPDNLPVYNDEKYSKTPLIEENKKKLKVDTGFLMDTQSSPQYSLSLSSESENIKSGIKVIKKNKKFK